ncbi:MAG: TIM barrel protein [Candidatus Micrarchaeia archaeon]|jgi:deoxyribonuclease-4
MRFGTAGIPLSCANCSSLEGIKSVAGMGLNAFEFEFVHGCRMSEENARQAGSEARKDDVVLSAHASYYLNLLSPEKAKYEKTVGEIMRTARVLQAAGGGRLVFHPGFYLGTPKQEAFKKMKNALKELIEGIEAEKLGLTRLSPETTGKPTAFGSFEELVELSGELGWKKLAVTIDWAHVHARDNGRIKGKESYCKLLEELERHCGKTALRELHCHMSSIRFSEKGELNHLTMDHDVPPFKPLAEALHEFGCDGTIISESPAIERDALRMKKIFESIN